MQFYMMREMLPPFARAEFVMEKTGNCFRRSKDACVPRRVFGGVTEFFRKNCCPPRSKKRAEAFSEKIGQDMEDCRLKAYIGENLQQLKQKTLYIYEALYENRLAWSCKVQETLLEMVNSTVLLEKVFRMPEEAKSRRALIQRSLSEENLAETDRLYLLADIVELFETLEKLW